MKYLYCLIATMSVTLSGCDQSNTANKQASVNITPAESINTTPAAKLDYYKSPLGDDVPTYKVAVILNNPYYYKDELGKPIGYDVDLIRAIGEEVGFKVDFKQEVLSEIFDALEKGSPDFALAGLSLTPERQKRFSTAKPYSKAKGGYMVLANSEYQTKEQLNDKKVGVISASNLARILTRTTDAEAIEKATMFLAFETILTKEAVAVFGFEPNLRSESKQFVDENYSFNFIPLSDDVYTTIYAKKDNQKLIDQVDKGLEKIRENGRYQKINEKWFGENISHFMLD